MKKATTINQMVLFPKPLRAWLMVSVPESAVAAIPNKAIAPMGNGFVMMPTMVATKIANRCQARGWTPEGGGTNHRITARKTTDNKTIRRFNSSPGGGGTDLPAGASVDGKGFPLASLVISLCDPGLAMA